MRKTVYVVLQLTLDLPAGTTNEEIDDILNDTDFSAKHPHVTECSVVENSFDYPDYIDNSGR